MKTGNRKRPLTPNEVRVQIGGDGALQSKGVLNRLVECFRLYRWRKIKGHLREAGQSLLAFLFGLLLASLYGAASLFLQKQPLWPCVYVTLGLATVASFGMGLSADILATVSVMLPSLCSAHGKNFLLFLCAMLVLSGPVANMLENTERAAGSLLCGAELAANQTQELMQRAAAPLSSALNRIREITRNAVAVAGRVQNFIHALTDGVRHIARTLRNVLHFLVDIGDVCNAKLGAPYKKCRALFTTARDDCTDLLGDFNFLCDIISGFMSLCMLARAGELFCIVPSYLGGLLKMHLSIPSIAAFERLKREFDFNVSASVTFDLYANTSRSLHKMTQDVMKEVSSELKLLKKVTAPLAYGSLVLLAFAVMRASKYRRRYLTDIDFDNFYITAQFKDLDRQVTSGGGASVLPLLSTEAKTYISPLSLQMSLTECRVALMGVVAVLRQAAISGVLVALDFLVFWTLDQVHHQMTVDIVARAPRTVAVQINGSGYASDIYRDIVASFNVLQQGNITVVSRKCLLEPSAPDDSAAFLLGFLLGLALVISMTTGPILRCRRLICALYYPEREMERIRFLRQRILDERRMVGGALRAAATAGSHGNGGQAGSRLQRCLRRLPGGHRMINLLRLSVLTCSSCDERVGPKDIVGTCDAQQCSAVFCQPCCHLLEMTCVTCAQPLTYRKQPLILDGLGQTGSEGS